MKEVNHFKKLFQKNKKSVDKLQKICYNKYIKKIKNFKKERGVCTMEKKITKKEMFAQIREVVADNADMVTFIDHEIELLSKKSGSKKPTAIQIANEGLKATILTVLEGSEGMTASEVLAGSDEFAGLSNQKITALLRQLVLDGSVIKVTDGKKTLFKLA